MEQSILYSKDYAFISKCFEDREETLVPFVFKVVIDEKASRKNIYSLFDLGKLSNILCPISSNELLVCIHDANEMKNLGLRLGNISGKSSIVRFSLFTPMVEYKEDESNYKIQLINYIDEETNDCVQRLFEGKLDRLNIDYKKNYYTGKLVVYSVGNIGKDTLDSIVRDSSFNIIYSIEPMPRCVLD